MDSIPLLKLRPGASGVLVAGAEAPLQRLLDLGFVPGTGVEMVRRMPFGGAVEIALRGLRLCIRRQDLQGLYVTTSKS